jgi:RNA polymerase sigma factor (sigma-70 family)
MALRSPTVAGRRRFEALYVEHYAAIRDYVTRRLANTPDEVPDVVAQVFTVAWRRLNAVPGGDEARLWLYGVARRAVADHERTRRRRSRLIRRLTSEARARPLSSGRPSPDRDGVIEAIERLPDGDREALRLVLWEGCSHAEAAGLLGCSVHAVALRLSKARSRLRADPLIAAQLRGLDSEAEPALDTRRR